MISDQPGPVAPPDLALEFDCSAAALPLPANSRLRIAPLTLSDSLDPFLTNRQPLTANRYPAPLTANRSVQKLPWNQARILSTTLRIPFATGAVRPRRT